MKKLVIDQVACIGCGACAVLAPKTYVMKDDGKAQVTDQKGDSPGKIQESLDNCPVQAISWKEE